MNQDNTNLEKTAQLDLEVQAKQLAGLLDENANRLSMRTLKQLEDGRTKAVKLHADVLAGASTNGNGTLSLVSAWAIHHRMIVSGLLLITILVSIVLFKSLSYKEPSDAFLLGSELPPEAFVDKGFEPSLNVSKNIKS